MVKNILLVLLLVLVWIILNESFTLLSLVIGILAGAGCIIISRKYIPLNPISGLKLSSLLLYPFYLIGQIYLAGFNAIKLILSHPMVEITEIKTVIKNDFLQVLLANSITLTPGTLSLALKNDSITVLWLREKRELLDNENPGEIIKGGLEKKLIKAERKN